ncbi:MAG: gliding motility-associated ABC transporter ATP-binding subunit GldA, partial [Bacteroidetes bacterium]
MMSIVIENLTKSYGSQKALDGVSLEIKSGQITG